MCTYKFIGEKTYIHIWCLYNICNIYTCVHETWNIYLYFFPKYTCLLFGRQNEAVFFFFLSKLDLIPQLHELLQWNKVDINSIWHSRPFCSVKEDQETRRIRRYISSGSEGITQAISYAKHAHFEVEYLIYYFKGRNKMKSAEATIQWDEDSRELMKQCCTKQHMIPSENYTQSTQ